MSCIVMCSRGLVLTRAEIRHESCTRSSAALKPAADDVIRSNDRTRDG